MTALPKPIGRQLDPGYLRAVRRLPCLLSGAGCWGPVEADHAGPRPVGRKADDRTAVPLCRQHHHQRTNACGWFRDLTPEQRRVWCERAIEQTQRAVERADKGATW